MNILLVEDNDVDALVFMRALKKTKLANKVVRARDGVEALEILIAKEEPGVLPAPYVILLDVNMPRMNGHEFLAALRSNENISSSRVIVLTTSDDPLDIELAYGKHASGYVVKPESTAEMSAIIGSLHDYWKVCKHPPHKTQQKTAPTQVPL